MATTATATTATATTATATATAVEQGGVDPTAAGQGMMNAVEAHEARDAAASTRTEAVNKVGFWSAVFVAISSLIFSATGLLGLLNILP